MSTFSFQEDGLEIRKALLTKEAIELVKSDIDLDSTKLKQHGIRNLEKRFSSIANLAGDDRILSIASELLQGSASLVRALFFDKTPEKNWSVSWHQDQTVTLNRRTEADGWGPWSIKDGVHHVRPPLSVINRMVTFRLHIDSADSDNGCLQFIPESHKYGLLSQSEIDEVVRTRTAFPCVVEAGDAIIMRPHVLHRSDKSNRPHHRRVIHLEFSSFELPDHTAWA